MRERKGAYGASVGKPEGKKPLPTSLLLSGRIILKWIFERLDGEHGLDRYG
jgi:hypothetical protein